MNAARNRQAAQQVLALAERSTDDLLRIIAARQPARPSRYLHPIALRRAAQHVLVARQITQPSVEAR